MQQLSLYLAPNETPKTERSRLKCEAIFAALPAPETIAQHALAGAAKRGWYARSAETIRRLYGADAPRFAALLAALSPQTSVELNWLNATRSWAAWVDAGRPTDRDGIIQALGRGVSGSKGVGSILGCWLNNCVTALSAPDQDAIRLSGFKVDSFRRNLIGDDYAVTNDTWVARYMGVRGDQLSQETLYRAVSARIRAAALLLGWSPAEVQETVWSYIKSQTEGTTTEAVVEFSVLN